MAKFVERTEQATCEGDDCFIISYETSDPRADRFNANYASGSVPFPPVGDPGFNKPPFPALRDAANREFERDRDRYQDKSKGCGKGCECSPSDNPADKKTSTFRREIVFEEDAEGEIPGAVVRWTVTASYQVKATKTLGFCVLAGSKKVSRDAKGIHYKELVRQASAQRQPRKKH